MAATMCDHLKLYRNKNSRPFVRVGHAAAVNGEEIYFFGGCSFVEDEKNIIYDDDFYRLAVRGGTVDCIKLEVEGHAPTGQAEHSMCLHNNQLYVYGGKNNLHAQHCLPGLYVYDIGYQKWEYRFTLGVAPSTLGHTMSCVSDMIYVYGGFLNREVTSQLSALNVEQLTWFKLNPSGSVTPRSNHSAAVIMDKIYIFGGCGGENIWLNDLIVLDTTVLKWIKPKSVGQSPTPRAYHTIVAHKNAYLYLFGGTNDSLSCRGMVFNDLHEYDIMTETWTLVECSPPAVNCYGHIAAVLQDSIYVVGGMDNEGPVKYLQMMSLSDNEGQVDESGANSLGQRSLKHKSTILKTQPAESLSSALMLLEREMNHIEMEKKKLEATRKDLLKVRQNCITDELNDQQEKTQQETG